MAKDADRSDKVPLYICESTSPDRLGFILKSSSGYLRWSAGLITVNWASRSLMQTTRGQGRTRLSFRGEMESPGNSSSRRKGRARIILLCDGIMDQRWTSDCHRLWFQDQGCGRREQDHMTQPLSNKDKYKPSGRACPTCPRSQARITMIAAEAGEGCWRSGSPLDFVWTSDSYKFPKISWNSPISFKLDGPLETHLLLVVIGAITFSTSNLDQTFKLLVIFIRTLSLPYGWSDPHSTSYKSTRTLGNLLLEISHSLHSTTSIQPFFHRSMIRYAAS